MRLSALVEEDRKDHDTETKEVDRWNLAPLLSRCRRK